MPVTVRWSIPEGFAPVTTPEELSVLADWFEDQGDAVVPLLRSIAKVWGWRDKDLRRLLSAAELDRFAGWMRYGGGWVHADCRKVSPISFACHPDRTAMTGVRWRAVWEIAPQARKPKWQLRWDASWKHVLIADALCNGSAVTTVPLRTNVWPFGDRTSTYEQDKTAPPDAASIPDVFSEHT